ncbi:TonB-dependent receptor [Novosphingobium nitrogenifigens]|uniref:TonB-dependent receptor n=1 Tax=Novosphingobium nitrogenifigens TaxID=378548 RepID=UPI0018DE634F|nr:TonB-dependent receptor [Novosphingobium nitrogenifigens]
MLPTVAAAETAAAPAADPAQASQAPAPDEGGVTITVLGKKAVHATKVPIGRPLIDDLPAGANPMAAIAISPGVNFQSTDPQGISTWSNQIFIHGFDQRAVGMTLDEMPLGEMTYRNYNGLSPMQALTSENVAGVDMFQSAGAESVAATNNLGGALAYTSVDPSHQMGASVTQGFGSYSNFHTFVRLESGDLNDTGTRFYVSYMRNTQDKWKGYGGSFYQQVNAKLVQPIGSDSSLTAYFNWSDLHELVYQDMSPDILNTLGKNVDYYYDGKASGYIAGYNAAQGSYPAGFSNLQDPLDASYYDGASNQSDLMGYLKADIAVTDRLRWVTTAYGHGEESQTTWTSPYFGSPNGSPLSELVKEPSIRRFGVVSRITYDVARNHIGLGVWYENNYYRSPMNAYSLPTVVDGVIQGGVLNPLDQFTNPFAQIFNQTYKTNTFTAFVQDDYKPFNNLTLHFGFKSILSTTSVGDGYLNTSYYGNIGNITSGVSLTTAKAFLPHIGIDWTFAHHHELFVDISENARTYAQSGFKLSSSPFAVTQAAFDQMKGSIKPETDWTYAIGYRYGDKVLDASLYAYRTNFSNRLQQITSGSAINPVSTVANVGGVTMNGVEALLTVRPVTGLSVTNSISYNHGVYDNDIVDSNGVHPIKGKQIVNYPRLMYKARVGYDIKRVSFYVDENYTGWRNYDYQGEYRVPGYWMTNIGIQWHVHKPSDGENLAHAIKGLTLSFNLNNVTNKTYIATMGETGNPMNGASAYTYQSMILGMPRSAFGTIKADF